MYHDRIDLYNTLEKKRGSKVILYATGDRRGMETKIASEVLDLFLQHLDPLGSHDKISLYLHTRGGDTLAAWSIVNLIRQFCNYFEVIVASKAHSAGTLICLGANRVIMTKQATLGPIDPSITSHLNPEVPGAPGQRASVSVEAINGYIELAKDIGIKDSEHLAEILKVLSEHVHPLVLGNVFRIRGQIRMLGARLLHHHYTGDEKIEKILSFLCSESGSHDYTIYRQEARNELGLDVETPDDELYEIIKGIYDDMAEELQLTEPFDPKVLLGAHDTVEYNLPRALIESSHGGSHRYATKGKLIRQRIQDPTTGKTLEGIHNQVLKEGWFYEDRRA